MATTTEPPRHLAPAGDPTNPTRTFAAALRRARVQRPDATAVVSGTVRLTYRDLGARVDALTAALHARGLRPGDRVAGNAVGRAEEEERALPFVARQRAALPSV